MLMTTKECKFEIPEMTAAVLVHDNKPAAARVREPELSAPVDQPLIHVGEVNFDGSGISEAIVEQQEGWTILFKKE